MPDIIMLAKQIQPGHHVCYLILVRMLGLKETITPNKLIKDKYEIISQRSSQEGQGNFDRAREFHSSGDVVHESTITQILH